MDSQDRFIQFTATSVAAAAVTFGYFVSPALRYTNPALLSTFGMLLAVGVCGIWSAVNGDWGKLHMALYSAFLLVGGVGTATQIFNVWDIVHVNDARCLAIERDMISAYPLRADGPGLYQAFGCRPQTDGNVMVSRDAVAERARHYRPR